MYRHGLGDCFLITLPRKARPDPYRILIDCGVILGTANASDMMTKVVENIVHDFNGNIDLLLVTISIGIICQALFRPRPLSRSSGSATCGSPGLKNQTTS